MKKELSDIKSELFEVHIPKWARTALLQWAEKAYRRGFQHGVLQAEINGSKHDSSSVVKFRFCNLNSLPSNSNSPLTSDKDFKCSLEERHFNYDPIPGVDIEYDKKTMRLIRGKS